MSELSLRKYLLVLVSCSSLLSLAKQLKADLQFSWSRIYVGNSNMRERERKGEGGGRGERIGNLHERLISA